MAAPRLLDLFCCAGGAGMGYHRAGFTVVGVDINPPPRYPFEFHQADALEYLTEHGHEFDAIHASPPCQRYTAAASLNDSADRHPDLLEPTRDALLGLGIPWIIENVPGAPMVDFITLCGSQFGMVAPDVDGELIQLRRHRQFESSAWLMAPGPCHHRRDMITGSVFGTGGPWKSDRRRDPLRAGGYVPAVSVRAELLGVDWMSKAELSQCIPPAYTEFLGAQLLASLPVR